DENIIISQTPKPGRKLKQGSKVNLIISKGAMPTTAATQPRVYPTTPAATQKSTNRSFGGLTLS
ncbi:MAG: PASTA domain-containing protein, partial [Ruminococcus sp.]|nr:PASTA domain-containing protein [Ruminococcus sp.]